MTPTLDLHMLGSWQAELNGKPLPLLPTRHTRMLLARLALAHPYAVPRAHLYLDLFAGKTSERASQHVRTTLYYLRRVLGDYLQSADQGVSLHSVLHIQHDVGRFEAAAQGLTRATLETAMRLYRGPFLGDTAGGWGAHERQRLQNLYLNVLRRAVVVAQAEGRPETVRDAALCWARLEPWEEQAHLALINALRADGDRAGAEATIAQARALLRTSAVVPPGAGFEALVREVARMPATVLVTQQPSRSHPNAPWRSAQRVERSADSPGQMDHSARIGAGVEVLVQALATGQQALQDGQLGGVVHALEMAEHAAQRGQPADCVGDLLRLEIEKVRGASLGSIGGRLLDQETNEPVSGATVVARGSDGQVLQNATTDLVDGTFAVNGLPGGRYTLYVEGYALEPAITIDLAEGRQRNDLVLLARRVDERPDVASTTPDDPGAQHPVLVSDGSGGAYLVWQRGEQLWQSRYSDGSEPGLATGWSHTEAITGRTAPIPR